VKKSIHILREIALQRGGKCLSEKYFNVKHRYEWECRVGHKWQASADSIINQKSWCPSCAGQRKITIEELKSICKAKGGVFLSEKYINAHTKYEVKCSEGHVFYPNAQSLLKGYWCKRCSSRNIWTKNNKKVNRDDYVKAGKLVGSDLISAEIPNRTTIKAEWQCYAKGHNFFMTYNNIHNHKQNCPKCQGKAKITFEDCVKIAEARNGKILSETYYPYELQLWQCKHGHKFSAKYSTIKSQKVWCPYCSQSVGERAVRYVFEAIFKKEFIKSRPKWLINKLGKRLELDGYCEELSLAFEHNGKQHYSSDYHRGTDKLMDNDKIKLALCQQFGVNLITVPEVPSLLNFEDLSPYIVKEIQNRGISIPKDTIIPNIDSSFRWSETTEEERLRRLERAKKYIESKQAILNKSEWKRRGKQYVFVFDIITIGGGNRSLSEHKLFTDDLWSTKRIDPLTKEEFFPKSGKQKFVNRANSWKYNNLKKSIRKKNNQ
jgi:hypothetical protein